MPAKAKDPVVEELLAPEPGQLTFDESRAVLTAAGVQADGFWSYVRTEDIGRYRNAHVYRGIRKESFQRALLVVPAADAKRKKEIGYKVYLLDPEDPRATTALRD